MTGYITDCSKGVKLYSVLTTIGICLFGQGKFYRHWSISDTVQKVSQMLPASVDISLLVGWAFCAASLIFVYICIVYFCKSMQNLLCDCGINKISKAEIAVYALIYIATICYVIITFYTSDVFYGSEIKGDVIYTADSSLLVQANAFLSLNYHENDLRQPLFAVFAAPFSGIPYLVSNLFNCSVTASALILNAVQVLLIMFGVYLFTKVLGLKLPGRILFMLTYAFSYTYLLFAVMMEQYAVAFFWLAIFVYSVCNCAKPSKLALCGAGGTLLTSLAMLPASSEKSPFANIKGWISDIILAGATFGAAVIAFCRFDVIFNATSSAQTLSQFTGKELTIIDKFYQYTAFVRNCFIAPKTIVIDNMWGYHYAWQLAPAESIDYIGVAIFGLAVAGFVTNRKKKAAHIAGWWVLISLLVLLVLGWGTQENGLILYSLYFGWAFAMLIWMLMEYIARVIRLEGVVYIIFAAVTAVLAVINIPAIADMISFAAHYFGLN